MDDTNKNDSNKDFQNTLYLGDNLDVMKDIIKQRAESYIKATNNPNVPDSVFEFIDLIYIDPPFNSKRDYSIFFEDEKYRDKTAEFLTKEQQENRAKNQNAMKKVFADTWSNIGYHETLKEISCLDNGYYDNISKYLTFLKDVMNTANANISYLSTMALRIIYMYKLLKKTGSFYLHCDPTMSHDLKKILDFIFGERNYRNEIIWKRKSSTGSLKSIGVSHDVIFYYVKNVEMKYTFNMQYMSYDTNYTDKMYNKADERGRYRLHDVIANPGLTGGGATYTYKDYHSQRWLLSYEKIKEMDEDNRIVWSKTGRPYRKLYLHEMKGEPIVDTWIDITNTQGTEKLGYPTQKPLALLDRIILASSNEGDVVADFFCGCGTSCHSAIKNNRHFIGADLSHISISLIKKRIREDETLKAMNVRFKIKGFPLDVESALKYFNEFESDLNDDNSEKMNMRTLRRREFEEWVIEYYLTGVVNEQATGIPYDGKVFFKTYNYETKKEIKMTCYVECKSGHVDKNMIRAFCDTITKLKVTNPDIIGVFACFKKHITSGFENEFRQLGMSQNPKIPLIELFLIDDLIEDKFPTFVNNATLTTFKGSTSNQVDL